MDSKGETSSPLFSQIQNLIARPHCCTSVFHSPPGCRWFCSLLRQIPASYPEIPGMSPGVLDTDFLEVV